LLIQAKRKPIIEVVEQRGSHVEESVRGVLLEFDTFITKNRYTYNIYIPDVNMVSKSKYVASPKKICSHLFSSAGKV
jgi:hypothetical protein